ncbi:MAG: hypothetical protein IE932_11950 [Sphingopyxis terrae]|nr:hypothetical protein [Sphingopyxis terrae]
MPYDFPHARYRLRDAYRELLSSSEFTHALTLNTDREMSATRLRDIFKNFCMNVDRVAHGKLNVRGIPSSERLLAIAFPENLTTNAHLHAVVDLDRLARKLNGEHELERQLELIWKKATRGSGSAHCKPRPDRGWASYITKKADWTDPTYWISTDFHPS